MRAKETIRDVVIAGAQYIKDDALVWRLIEAMPGTPTVFHVIGEDESGDRGPMQSAIRYAKTKNKKIVAYHPNKAHGDFAVYNTKKDLGRCIDAVLYIRGFRRSPDDIKNYEAWRKIANFNDVWFFEVNLNPAWYKELEE